MSEPIRPCDGDLIRVFDMSYGVDLPIPESLPLILHDRRIGAIINLRVEDGYMVGTVCLDTLPTREGGR